MKAIELNGVALDWAVASAEGYSGWDGDCFTLYQDGYPGGFFIEDYRPSRNWAQGGPIIEREGIHIGRTHSPAHMNKQYGKFYWIANGVRGQTPLIAAMRCYVASKLGDEIEIPKEITDENAN